MWDLPGPGLELMSPGLAGGFLTTAPPGKSLYIHFKLISVGGHKVEIDFFFPCGSSFDPGPFITKTIHSPLNCSGTFFINQVTTYV